MAARLQELELALTHLSDAEKAQLARTLLVSMTHAFTGVEKKNGISGGDACIVRTRIPIWTIETYRRLGWTDAQILDNFPALRAADLVNAYAYADAHPLEIEEAIREHDEV
ncbi:MAG TPA: DUF433 domain-containing protein [Polyangium sp.]|nr:DUF433 domain-containing protein [Polyangium sp.]